MDGAARSGNGCASLARDSPFVEPPSERVDQPLSTELLLRVAHSSRCWVGKGAGFGLAYDVCVPGFFVRFRNHRTCHRSSTLWQLAHCFPGGLKKRLSFFKRPQILHYVQGDSGRV